MCQLLSGCVNLTVTIFPTCKRTVYTAEGGVTYSTGNANDLIYGAGTKAHMARKQQRTFFGIAASKTH